MNHTSQGLKTGKAVQGFLQAKAAEALSPRTLAICSGVNDFGFMRVSGRRPWLSDWPWFLESDHV